MASLAFRLVDDDRYVGLAGELAQLTDKFVLIRQRTPLSLCLSYIVLFRANVQGRGGSGKEGGLAQRVRAKRRP